MEKDVEQLNAEKSQLAEVVNSLKVRCFDAEENLKSLAQNVQEMIKNIADIAGIEYSKISSIQDLYRELQAIVTPVEVPKVPDKE